MVWMGEGGVYYSARLAALVRLQASLSHIYAFVVRKGEAMEHDEEVNGCVAQQSCTDWALV